MKHSGKSDYDAKVAHVDHRIPLSKWNPLDGDPDDIKNLQGLCPDCNLSKSNRYSDISKKEGGLMEGEIYTEIIRCTNTIDWLTNNTNEQNAEINGQLFEHLNGLRTKLSCHTNYQGKGF